MSREAEMNSILQHTVLQSAVWGGKAYSAFDNMLKQLHDARS